MVLMLMKRERGMGNGERAVRRTLEDSRLKCAVQDGLDRDVPRSPFPVPRARSKQ